MKERVFRLKKQQQRFMILAVLTIIHLIFSSFYLYFYGYFNGQNLASFFVVITSLLRYGFLLWIAVWGYLAMKHTQKAAFFYLALFFINLIFPYFF
ncbi:hypothetical protein I8F93_15615 [Enterococcus gallinarum]|nr:hypothetical protein [Enterococcus gallinarum]